MGMLRRARDRLGWEIRSYRRRRILGTMASVRDVQAKDPDFSRLRQVIREAGTDNLSHFNNGYTHEGGLALQQNPDEFAALCCLLKRHGPYPTYLEIGTASGGSALLLFREVGFDRVICIDDGRHPRAHEQRVNLSAIPNVTRHVGDSHAPEAREFLAAALNGSRIDLAFVDGDHSAEGVWQDLELTLPFCRPGSLLVLHDTNACEGVDLAWIRLARERLIQPLAEFLGDSRPLGIGVGRVC
jgi:cephalosporin hydroxylase